MASIEELKNVRLEKLNIIKAYGMNPYPAQAVRDLTLSEVVKDFKKIEETQKSISVVGRIMSIRGQGAIIFVSLFDGTEKFQAVFKKDEIEEKLFKLFTDAIDIGDFIQVSGTLFTTERGQESLLVNTWTILTKSLLPLPDKWHGLQDDDERFRKRYLEMITDSAVYDRMIKRSHIVRAIRNFFDNLGFIEVETPILQNQAGGANAKTFETHHLSYDIPMVLRIAVELDHKIIMTSGIPRIYEIGKMFRNEGSDPSHIQEFTMIEWYSAYNTLDENIKWTEDLLKHLAHDIVGKDEFRIKDKDGNEQVINFSGNWTREKFGDLLKQYANIDFVNITDDELKNEVRKYGMPDEEMKITSRANMLDYIYKRTARPKLINPTFVTNYPGVLKPLAQQNADGTAEVAQLIIAGAEITNQYAELVDPIVQRQLMENQAKARTAGDAEAMDIDERFLTAMEHGMPPMTGFGMGIDRIVAILTEQNNLRDTIFFPIMKPKDEAINKKETMIAIACVNTGIGLEKWQEMNTIAHLNAAFGARVGKGLFIQNTIESKDKQKINLNVKNAIMIKSVDSSENLRNLALLAKEKNFEVDEFTREMLETTNDKKVIEITASKNLDEIEYLGVLIYGPKNKVEELTKDFTLFS